MAHRYYTILIMACTVLALSSCLGKDEEVELTYYEDTAVTSFTLGTLNRHLTTKAKDGSDSTYVTTINGSAYKFYIDQVRGLIYNVDSLPIHTDVAHVLTTIATKNAGIPVWMYKTAAGKDTVALYSNTDSLDFSKPRTLRVYNTTGTQSRQYTVTVNVHRQTGNELTWKAYTVSGLENWQTRKLVATDNATYLFAANGTATHVWKNVGTDEWQPLEGVTFDATAWSQAVAQGNTLFVLSDKTLYSSTDGLTWQSVGTPSIDYLLGASPKRLYALTGQGPISSRNGGKTWMQESIDDEITWLPTGEMSLAVKPHPVNDNTYKVVLLGRNSQGKLTIWSKVEENDDTAEEQPWSRLVTTSDNYKQLPDLMHPQLVVYDGKLLATGGTLSKFYVSPDDGLTWSVDTVYDLPSGASVGDEPASLCVTPQGRLWLTQVATDKVWTAQLARTAWKHNPTAFTQ